MSLIRTLSPPPLRFVVLVLVDGVCVFPFVGHVTCVASDTSGEHSPAMLLGVVSSSSKVHPETVCLLSLLRSVLFPLTTSASRLH